VAVLKEFSLNSLPGLVLAIPYAWLSSKVPKTTLLLIGATSIPLGMTCFFYACKYPFQYSTITGADYDKPEVSRPDIFPVRSVYLAVLFTIFGGGASIAYTLLYAILAETVAPEKLAATFYRVAASLLLVRFLGETAAARALQLNPAIIAVLAPIIYAMSIIPIWSRKEAKKPQIIDPDGVELLCPEDDSDNEEDGALPRQPPLITREPKDTILEEAGDILHFFKYRLMRHSLLRRFLITHLIEIIAVTVGKYQGRTFRTKHVC
jgi:MFS family permease